jgi:hypothetical protein
VEETLVANFVIQDDITVRYERNDYEAGGFTDDLSKAMQIERTDCSKLRISFLSSPTS